MCEDLVAKENVEKWLKYLRNELPTVPFKASTQQQSDRLVIPDYFTFSIFLDLIFASALNIVPSIFMYLWNSWRKRVKYMRCSADAELA